MMMMMMMMMMIIKKLGQSASVYKRHDAISQAASLAQGIVKAKRQVMQWY
jgi:hypothetical protein